ncbi:hypothetical protein ON010_g16594 [Phytophthora cinnamomi]|nr:hypothetical protein ON010_g16594 [Phytophthora cinnamomi]
MDHEIHKLMQFELEQANAPVYTNDPAQSYQSEQGQQPAVSSGMDSGYSQNQISQSHSYEYAQALAKAQEQEQVNCSGRSSSFSTPRQSMSGDVSFQSLMENQNQGYGRDGMQSHQQQNTPSRVMSMQNLQQMGNQFYPTSSMTPPTSQNFAIHSNVSEMASQSIPRNMMEVQQQQGNFHMQHQQQQMQHSGSMRPQSRVTTFQEFTAQIQHLDKSVLIELLWNQRSALARWQNQAKQLELRLAAQQQTAASNMGSPAGFQSPYNSPMIGGGTFASPNIAAEAEMERSRDRSNSRMAQLPHQQQQQMPQYPYSQQQSTPSNATYSQADGTWENPQLYWQRIRNLKTSYEDQLRTAQRALAHNTAPPNSIYSMKAQSMMQNISMVLNILNEPPTNVQPRKFEVLNSIERFMHVSVIPIVQKVLSSGSTPQVSQAAVTSRSSPAMRASVATYSPSVPSTQGNAVGMSSTLTQSPDNQYTGARWTSFGEMDTPRQHSRGIFGDAESGEANGPPRMMDGLTAVENSPNNAGCESTVYAPVRAENDTQSDTSMGQQNMLYEAPTVTLKESSSLSLPALESRPSTITDTRLSSDASLSPGGSARDSSSKVMDSTSVDDDFSDFPVLEFEDPVADGNSFVKENNPSNVSRKRGIEDV